jgi:hypothetical protein
MSEATNQMRATHADMRDELLVVLERGAKR